MHTNRTAAIYGILAIGSRAWVYVRDPYSGQIMPLRPTADPEYDSDNERTGVPGGIGSGDPNCFDMLTKHGASRMEDTIFEMMVEWKGLLGFS
ncbi:hypothetical protein DL93DRAFT_2071784 [Clavulina sp. PMI_390]|nr:hypothetical protein DL93DRAFT_2071784 [Clavulina sp. PMI_390]